MLHPGGLLPSSCSFTYEHYREILERLSGAGSRFLRFGERPPRKGAAVWLRHDVDMDPESTLPLAEVEAASGALATYLFLVTSSFYNALEPSTARCIRRLLDLGHEVGLHLNLRAYREGEGSIAALARQEAAVLELVTARPVKVLSFHRPTPDLLDRVVPGFISAYGPAYFSRSKYLSDSAMRWREGCACGHADKRYPRLQLLTHAEWWSTTPGDREERLDRYRRTWADRWDASVATEVIP